MKNLLILIVFFTAVTGSYSQVIEMSRNLKKPVEFEHSEFPKLPFSGNQQNIIPIGYQDFVCTTRDFVHLDGRKYFPLDSNPYNQHGYPVIVMIHGFGESKEKMIPFAIDQAQYGYVVYIYSVRGQGNSGGITNVITDSDGYDLIDLVNYIRHDNTQYMDTSRILVMGSSQGGIIAMHSSVSGLRVNTIISTLASPSFASSWIENGCVKMTYLWTLSYPPDTARYTQLMQAMYGWIFGTGTKNDKWDSIAYYTPIARDFQSQVSNMKIPIFVENSWQDYFFNASGNINSIPYFPAKHMAYFGSVMGHGGDSSLTENIWRMNMYDAWYFYFLFNVQNGLFTTRPKYHYAFTSYPRSNDMWSFVHDSSFAYPPAGFNNVRLYFSDNHHLSLTQQPNSADAVFKNKVLDENFTMEEAVAYEFTGPEFYSAFRKDTIYFDSDPMPYDVKMTGIPVINLKYRCDRNLCQYNFQMDEVLPSGQSNLVSRLNYTDRYYTANTVKTAAIAGQASAHIFKQGSKIRIVATNLDTHPQDHRMLETNPFVLPVLLNSNNYLSLNGTYIDLKMNSSLYAESHTGAQNKSGFKLYQNYPNPFNPETNIDFTLPEGYSGTVSLKIYDSSGREISQLVNQTMTAGTYHYRLTSDNYTSGIYFCRMTAGDFSKNLKLILIK